MIGIIFFINDRNIYYTDNYYNITKYTTNSGNKSYYMVIEIPSIKLWKELYEINNKFNNVNKNIQVMNSDTPLSKNGNIILSGHSGNSKVSFFTKLDKLKENDVIYIYYDKIKNTYTFKYKYVINKNGILNIYRNKNKNTLTLVTCDKKDKTKQIVYIYELKKAD